MTTTVAEALGELRDIHELVPSPLNPRTQFDPEKLKELAASIESKGIIEPLIVRSRPGFGQLEIVAGERRYRAAKSVGLKQLPVIVRTLSDVEVLELMAIENGQRDDLHPLEEANGYRALMKADTAYTPKAIAAKIGKSERYVQQRLHLATLIPAAQKSFLANEITAGHADLIARLSPDYQAAALKACFHNLYGEDKENGVSSVRALDGWIRENVRLRLSSDDPQTELFPELEKAIDSVATGATILQIANTWVPEEKLAVLEGALPQGAWRQIESKKSRCKHAQRAVVVLGRGRGQFLEVCVAKAECKVHWRWEIEQAARVTAAKGSTAKAKKTAASKPSTAAVTWKKKQDATAAIANRRADALEEGARQLRKKPIKPGPAVLAVLREGQYGAVRSWAELVASIVGEDLVIRADKDWKRVVRLLKPLGVRLDVIEKALAETAAQTSAGKKASKAA